MGLNSKEYLYTVAGHSYKIVLEGENNFSDNLFLSYKPFLSQDSNSGLLFSVSMKLEDLRNVDLHITEHIGIFSGDHGTIKVCRYEDGYHFECFVPGNEKNEELCAILRTSMDFTESNAFITSFSRYSEYALTSCLMMLYAFTSSRYQTLLVHASAIMYENRGFIFLGKSGTGKSTHSRLWLDNITGTELLNDDNPILRIIDGQVWVFGSPWSGKTPCYKNQSFPLEAIVRLWQRTDNSMKPLRPVEAMAALLPTASCLPCVEEIQQNVLGTVETIIGKTAFYALFCRADKAAAMLCHKTIVR